MYRYSYSTSIDLNLARYVYMYMLHVHVHVHVHVNVHARRYMYSCTKFHAKFRDDLWHRSVRFQWPRFRESEYESVPKLEKFLLKWHGFDWRCAISRFCFDFDWWRRYELPYFKKWLVQSRKIYTGTLEIRKRGTRYRSKSGNFISFFRMKSDFPYDMSANSNCTSNWKLYVIDRLLVLQSSTS